MDKTTYLTIYCTFERLDVVKQTLPGVIEETRRNDARLIVHDSSMTGRKEKWDYLNELNSQGDFFLILSSNISMAHARNMCLQLGQELYAPEYICMLEDDHGYRQGLIPEMIHAMQTWYGKKSPNGLLFGLFTGCGFHHTQNRGFLAEGHSFPLSSEPPARIGKANSCFRCAPTAHWNNVLKGYDTDEYLISTFQTSNLNKRNYHKGFTVMYVKNGDLSFQIESRGRGFTTGNPLQRWDETYTASDKRSNYQK
ncbi:MAG TPA: hypothetical protein PK892_13690 [Bacteroidales bacterium]|nr:hypothetical protein [Bacteroidales bacterium]